jgi:hypothetical protein
MNLTERLAAAEAELAAIKAVGAARIARMFKTLHGVAE